MRINQNQVATVSWDHTFNVWDLRTGTVVNSYAVYAFGLTSCAILPNGQFVTGSTSDMFVRFWNMDAQTLKSVPVTTNVQAMVFTPKYGVNGALIAVGSNILIFDATSTNLLTNITTGKFYNALDVHATTGNVLLISNANNVLDYLNVTVNWANFPLTYNASTGKVKIIRILPDNVTAAIGIDDGKLQMFSLSTFTWGNSYTCHNSSVNDIQVTPDKLYIVSGAADASLVMWLWGNGSLWFVNKYTAANGIFSIAFMEPTFIGSKSIFVLSVLSSQNQSYKQRCFKLLFYVFNDFSFCVTLTKTQNNEIRSINQQKL
jgi:WD40 repeat protein